jgi:hypothetical protein
MATVIDSENEFTAFWNDVTAQLHAAGFTDATFERVDGPVMIGRDVGQAVEFQPGLGPADEIVREAGPLAEARRGEIGAAWRRELARHAGKGGIWRDSSSWTIAARNPRGKAPP